MHKIYIDKFSKPKVVSVSKVLKVKIQHLVLDAWQFLSPVDAKPAVLNGIDYPKLGLIGPLFKKST